MSTIYILWLRQLKRYFRSRVRLVGSLGQPLLFLVALGWGFSPIYQRAGGGNYIQFLVPGIIGMSILFMAVHNGIEIIWDKQFGFLRETLVAPVSRFEIMLGRTLGGATVASIQGFLVFMIALLVGFRPATLSLLPLAFVFVILTAILFTALGTAIASLLEDMYGFSIIMNFVIQPIFFLSGALFPLANLPSLLVKVAMVDPLSYGIDGLRGALVGGAHFGLAADFLILSIITLILLAIGSYLFSKIQI